MQSESQLVQSQQQSVHQPSTVSHQHQSTSHHHQNWTIQSTCDQSESQSVSKQNQVLLIMGNWQNQAISNSQAPIRPNHFPNRHRKQAVNQGLESPAFSLQSDPVTITQPKPPPAYQLTSVSIPNYPSFLSLNGVVIILKPLLQPQPTIDAKWVRKPRRSHNVFQFWNLSCNHSPPSDS